MRALSWAVVVAVVMTVSPAWAGRIYLFPESAYVPSGSSCAKSATNGTHTSYTTVNCTTATLQTNFRINAALPPDSGNTWSYRIWYQTTDTAASKSCVFQVIAVAYPDTARLDLGGAEPTATATGGPLTHANNKIYKTDITSSTAIYNRLTGANCSSTQCQDAPVKVEVSVVPAIFNADSASTCNVRMIEVQY